MTLVDVMDEFPVITVGVRSVHEEPSYREFNNHI